MERELDFPPRAACRSLFFMLDTFELMLTGLSCGLRSKGQKECDILFAADNRSHLIKEDHVTCWLGWSPGSLTVVKLLSGQPGAAQCDGVKGEGTKKHHPWP